MRTERCYRVLSHEFRLVAPAREMTFLHRFLAPFEGEVPPDASRYEVVLEPDEERPWAIYRDGRRLLRGRVPSTVLEFALWDVNTSAVASDHGMLAVHAAAASWHGSGILLPAPPDSGKSTLVAGLTRAGCSYLTDEAALIDPSTALLHPFPRSLWLERPSVEAVFGSSGPAPRWVTGRQFHVRPADLRPRAIGRACRVRHIIAPTYVPGAETSVVPASRAETLMLLAQQSFNMPVFGGAGVRLLGRVVSASRCWRAVVGDLDRAVRLILDSVERDRSRPGRPEPKMRGGGSSLGRRVGELAAQGPARD